MREQQVLVPSGYIHHYENGQTLTVTDRCAVGDGVRLYCTEAWANETAAYRRAWTERSLLRRALGLPPSGYAGHQIEPPYASIVAAIFG